MSALNHIIRTQFSDRRVKAGSIWKYHNFAVSDKTGSVFFTKQSKTENPGFEGMICWSLNRNR
jgi:hypothetical protein